uniref:Uncharacterized protein n=1 Tax=Caenorhabditis japonica TaxID=281687 RepID=A0A8R1IL52_CAEJA
MYSPSPILLLSLLLCVGFVASHVPLSSFRLMRELEQEIEYKEHLKALSRARRTSNSLITCGPKVFKWTLAVCGESCNSNSGKNLASECCDGQCDDEYIRKWCCPDK